MRPEENFCSPSTEEDKPPLHFIPGVRKRSIATAIDFAQMKVASPEGPEEVEMDARFVEYFASRNVGSMLCVRVPYHDGTFAIMLLQLYNSSVGRVWREDDMLLLQEASAQVEIGLSHARAFEEERKSKELAWRNAALEQEKKMAETASQAKSVQNFYFYFYFYF